MGPFLVAIVAILAWAVVQASRNWASGASQSRPSAELQQIMEEMTRAMERADAERRRLTQRVQNLEAIVTTETFDLAQKDPEAARIDLPEVEDTPPEEQAEQIARRIRH